MINEAFGLGRRRSADEQDQRFPIRKLLRAEPARREYRYWWPEGWWGNQQNTPQCVAYAWLHLLEDGPITQIPKRRGAGPVFDPGNLYRSAQRVDEWEGQDYDGTSVRAGAKVLQRRKIIDSYWWAWSLEALVDAVLTLGPVVVGTNWYMDMFLPDRDGRARVSGTLVGGHAYVVNGVNVKKEIVRIKNSWGRHWGRRGHALLSFDDMARLLREDGEACIAMERTK